VSKEAVIPAKPDQQRLVGALETIVEVLVDGKIEAVQSVVRELRTDLEERIESVRTDALTAAESMQAGLASLSTEMHKRIDEIEKRRAVEHTALEGTLAEQENRLRVELGQLGGQLSATQLGLHQQMAETERITTLFNNLASVFSGNGGAYPPPSNVDSPELPDAQHSGAASGETLDEALNQVFPEDDPSKAVPPPVNEES
jgi:hypothetical protein